MRTLPVLLLLVVACGETASPPGDSSDAGAAVTDGHQDAGTAIDAGTTVDAGSPADAATVVDAGNVVDAGSLADAGTSVDAGTTVDAGSPVDAGTSPSGVKGQCEKAGDCTTGDCTVSAPGGFCLGCTDDADCGAGDGRSYTCSQFGSCNLDCASDSECPSGLRCNTSAGVCVLKSCGTCLSPLVCEGGFCRRRPCDASCPAGKCHDGRCTDD